MSTKREVEKRLLTLVERLNSADDKVRDDLARTLPEPRVIQVDVPDLDLSYWSELSGGMVGELREGPASRADIRLSASSDDLVAVVDGTKSLFSSYLAGQVKIQASLSDLMALRRLA